RDGLPDRGEHVLRPAEEVSGSALHIGIRERDHDRAGDQRENHGEHRDHSVAGGDPAHSALPAGGLSAEVARWRDDRLDLGTAHAPASSVVSPAAVSTIPAIIRPIFSRLISPGTMPTTLPRYITM